MAHGAASGDYGTRQLPTLGMDWDVDPTTLSEHAQFIRGIDWESSAIGPPSHWPQQLVQTIDLILADPTPSAVLWGDQLTMIYNEGFISFAALKHPKLMGMSPMTEYAEVWPMFEDIIKRGRTTGQATRHKDVRLLLDRNGYAEECFVTYTFVPLFGPEKTIVGFYHTALETTSQVLAARRTQTLMAIGDVVTASRSLREYWTNLLKVLETNTQDMPWALAYSFTKETSEDLGSQSSLGPSSHSTIPGVCSLAGATGRVMGQVPLGFDRREEEDGFVKIIKKSITNGESILLRHTDPNFPPWILDMGHGSNVDGEQPCRSALMIPIRPTTRNDADGENVIGFLIVGLAAFRDYDKDYEQFAHLCSRQLATSAASVMLLEQEIQRQEHLTQQLSISAKQTLDLENKLSRFAEISNIGMWISSLKGELLYANKAWYEQAGIPFNTPGMNVEKWMPLVTEDSLEKFQRNWTQLLVDRQPVTFECQFKSRWRYQNPVTGELLEGGRWFLISACPEFGDDGNIKGAWGCNVDVSYQKWAQNLKDERLHEVTEAKRQSENFIDMTSHEMRNPLSAILQSADSITQTIEETAKIALNGSKIQFDGPSVDSMAESATTIATCAQHQKRILDDILTMSKLDASLLVVTPTEVDPIATIQHALQLHQQEFKTSGVEGYVRIDSSYHDLKVDRVFLDPSRLLQVLINLLTNAIKFTQYQSERRVTLHLGASVESPGQGDNEAHYFSPRAHLKKPPNRGADWGTGQELYLRFAVEDTGCGLNNDEMHRLFTRFSQASPKTHVQYGGSGLGLFICKELTELQGGRIGVSSTPGIGSTFKFYLKARRAQPVEETADANAAGLTDVTQTADLIHSTARLAIKTLKDPQYTNMPNRRHSSQSNPIVCLPTDADALHVLIVEDNLINQKVMANQLRKAKCTVHVANHGADALAFLNKTTFAKDYDSQATPLSVVLMDLEMPVMDGLTCVKIIREMQHTGAFTRPVPVIAVTANARFEQVKVAKDHGMDDVVTKPFRIGELIPQMYSVIERISV